MKKTNNIIVRIIKAIFSFFDRWLITPITKLFMDVIDFFKQNGKNFEKLVTHRQSLVVISLLFALLAFYLIDQKHATLIDNSAEVLYGQKVTATYNEALYVVEGIPETTDITLIGRRWDVYLAKQYPIDGVTLDLNGLGVGNHTVQFKYEQKVSSVEYKIYPPSVNVTIYDKVSETRELSTDVIHKDNLDSKLNIESVVLNRDNVIIKGAAHHLSEVAIIKAIVDIDNLTSTKVGSTTLLNVPLVAYDKDGNKVDVEIVPEKVDATVRITSPSKKVPIRLNVEGELDGRAIKSLTPNISQVTIWGNQSVIDEIEELPVTVNVDSVSEDRTYTINLVKPSGIREISEKTITIKLVTDAISSVDVEDIPIESINIGPNLKAQALSEDDKSLTVIVRGSASVIDEIDTSQISVFVDLEGLGVGEHEVDVQVVGPDSRLVYTPRVRKVKIRITKE